MGAKTVAAQTLLPEAELARIARILARFLAGRQHSPAGAAATGRTAGQGQEFLDYRQYQPGDDVRAVDWRASARSSALQVRRYSADVASDWYMCVDVSASMGAQGGANRELARKLSAALAYVLLHLGHRVGVLLFTGEIEAACPLGRGHNHYARILRTLTGHRHRQRGGSSDPGCCAAVVGQQHPLLIISDFLAEDAMVAALSKLQASRRQLHLFQLDCQQQWQLPNASEVLLEDIESGRSAVCSDLDAAQSSARLTLANVHRELSDWCSRYQVPLTRCGSDDNWRDVLLRHFARAESNVIAR
jgi:uncharacterized protein (DUF58 family)